MFLTLIITIIPCVFSQSIYDLTVATIKCSCDRETGLDVSKTKVCFTNHASDGKEYCSFIGDAIATILKSGGLSTNQCVDMLIPGFNTNITHYSVVNAKCGYSQRQCKGAKTFLIVIDHYEYTKGSALSPENLILYHRAVKFVKSIGEAIGKFLCGLFKSGKLDPDNLSILGHSLGAPIAHYLAIFVKKESSFPIRIIYGADMTGPCYDDCPNEHLKSGDADLVVAFHCTEVLGSKLSLCDYDFFSNDGKSQSDCPSDFLIGMTGAMCSHYSCLAIALLPAIKNDIWAATNCPSYDYYKSGKCSGNNTTLAGYTKTPVGVHGKYYFNSSNYNCTKN